MKRNTLVLLSLIFVLASNAQKYIKYSFSDDSFIGFYTDIIDSITNNDIKSSIWYNGSQYEYSIADFKSINFENSGYQSIVEGDNKVYEISFTNQKIKMALVDSRGTMIMSTNGDFGSNDSIIIWSSHFNPLLFITNEEGIINQLYSGDHVFFFEYGDNNELFIVDFNNDNIDEYSISDYNPESANANLRRSPYNLSFLSQLGELLVKAETNQMLKSIGGSAGVAILSKGVNSLKDAAEDPENRFNYLWIDGLSIAGDVLGVIGSIGGIATGLAALPLGGGVLVAVSAGGLLLSGAMFANDVKGLWKHLNPDKKQLERYAEYYKKKYAIQLSIFAPRNVTSKGMTLLGGFTTFEKKRNGNIFFNYSTFEDDKKELAQHKMQTDYSYALNLDISTKPYTNYSCWLSYEFKVDGLDLSINSDTIGFTTPYELYPMIVSFEQTGSEYRKNAFENNGKKYSFKYNCATTIGIESLFNVEDWGYIYIDPDGGKKYISMMEFGFAYTDTRYAYYRNTARSTVTFQPYVKYKVETYKVTNTRAEINDNDGYWYGEPLEFELVYNQHTKAETLDATTIEQTSAKVWCKYEDFSIVDGACGVEYWSDDTHLEKTIELSEDGEVEIDLTDLQPGTTYYYRAFIKIGDGYIRAEETKSFTTKQMQPQFQLCPDDDHPHLIDLGLPSGTKWACCNVGASSPLDYGGYYAWGEINEKDEYVWETYSHYDHSTYSSYSNSAFINIGSDISGTSNDVAHVRWGDLWEMPSADQCRELTNNTTSVWVTLNGVNGMKFIGSNGSSIFIPAAGDRWNSDSFGMGERGGYWLSTQNASYLENAWSLFISPEALVVDSNTRYGGQPIRPVQSGISVITGDATDIKVTSTTIHGNCSKGISNAGFSVKKEGETEYVRYSAIPDEDGNFSVTIEDLDIESKYYYYAFVQVDDKTYQGEELSVSTKPLCPDNQHPHMIDLGLPSGTKWACCNVGASKPEESGGYYAWGETDEKSEYSWNSYLYGITDPTSGMQSGVDIGNDISRTQYDVAYVKWGAAWQMPSYSDFNELSPLSNGTDVILRGKDIIYNDVKGWLVVGINDKAIFLPYAGEISWEGKGAYGSCGAYWTSSMIISDPKWADNSNRTSAYQFYVPYIDDGNASREYGFTVRPIAK